MNLISLVAVGIIAAVLSIILKQYKPEFGIYISLTAGIIILSYVMLAIKPVLAEVTALTRITGVNSVYGEILLKGLAICYITSLAGDTCKDAGESAIASKIELAGKIAIIVIALPMFKSLTDIIKNLIGS
jgi:stage III sporulation protein AD